MNVFQLRDRLIADYSSYVRSFIQIRDDRIARHVEEQLKSGLLWPEPLIQLNPAFEPGRTVDELTAAGILHPECSKIFRVGKTAGHSGKPLRLHQHQEEAIHAARTGASYALTTGTGSGKSLAFIIPIIDSVLRRGSGKGIHAIIVYPMNALANSQMGELEKFLGEGYPPGRPPVTFRRYTGQESDEERQQIIAKPPDLILTNYVMLELILTRPYEGPLVESARGLKFLVLDELHTYRGRQGADVSMLVRRVREVTGATDLQCVGTSATVAGTGSLEEQRRQVAQIASTIFGSPVAEQNVIGETLRRTTPESDPEDPEFRRLLMERITDADRESPLDYENYVADPLSSWIESTFGVTKEPGGRLVRSRPRTITGEQGAARDLNRLTGVPEARCAGAIEECLLAAYLSETPLENGFRPFAFRLHQFISRGNTVFASLEDPKTRHITVHGQQYVPGDRQKLLLPLVFCRECGQEYYCVRRTLAHGQASYEGRELSDRDKDQDSEPGYLFFSHDRPWPEETDYPAMINRIPEDWAEEVNGAVTVSRNRQDYLPKTRFLLPSGTEAAEKAAESDTGIRAQYFSAPFRFCLTCGVSYDFTQRSDFGKVSALGSEGRSTATTILSLSAVRSLKLKKLDLPDRARKLLSFTDNRQDASLQSGHFNDFVEIGILRAGLYRAVAESGAAGLSHDELTLKVFSALDLPFHLYAFDPEAMFLARTETEKALRNVLGYRLYRDLKRGWRITSPNLEQCGLLEIQYESLDDLCQAGDMWADGHRVLSEARPKTRAKIAKVLLDFMRRELAIHVDYLDSESQERIRQQSSQRLKSPWALDENEQLEQARILLPRSRKRGGFGGYLYLSSRGAFARYLRRPNTFPESTQNPTVPETEEIIRQLLEVLKRAGLVRVALEPREPGEVPGYQLVAAAMRWMAGDGNVSFHDPVRMPTLPEGGGRTNRFFVQFYSEIAREMTGVEAREHTAQVPYELRQLREDSFREARLPILYCSPTMELGVDIAELNVVNMRNVPPTPANYAQRSGRAGRSGQPALVFTYCAGGSPHDQYFFKRPDQMVAGAVKPPRLDLANEDLVRAHVHAIWLAQTGLSLGTSLKDVLEVSGESPTLDLQPHVQTSITAEGAKIRARETARRILAGIQAELETVDWHGENWLDSVISRVDHEFDRACDRWRNLYRAAKAQFVTQNRIIADAARSYADKETARSLRREAEAQLALLTESRNIIQSDFYSYRYFASEGFLPGYNFPRLPLSAFIPARKGSTGESEFLSRPRFLAISEFGPRAIIYHEGSRYIINKVILPVAEDERDLATHQAKQCSRCGYFHPLADGSALDLCQRCGAGLGAPLTMLLRMNNVSTHRRDSINCDEEERLRLGYEIRTAFRFAEPHGRPARRNGEVFQGETKLAELTHGHASTIWRFNLGWLRRQQRDLYGFLLDTERGFWAKNPQAVEDDPEDPLSSSRKRVIPYVEDRKNCLILALPSLPGIPVMASLQAALKNAIQVTYQLEESELAAEPLPDRDNRRVLLFYESAEGGAGVLRHLLEDPGALAVVSRKALEICHFDPDSGADLGKGPRSDEICEAACYDCLLSYSNQRDHKLLDRKVIREVLIALRDGSVRFSPGSLSPLEHSEQLLRQCQSELERQWLRYIQEQGCRLPDRAQVLLQQYGTRPDFYYDDSFTAIYIDGPHHEFPERHQRDREQTDALRNAGITIIRFRHNEEWQPIIDRYKQIFGKSL